MKNTTRFVDFPHTFTCTSEDVYMKRHFKSMDVNFCRTFISSISLFLELAGSDLVQTLLNPSKVKWYHSFLLNLFVVFVNVKSVGFRIESFS